MVVAGKGVAGFCIRLFLFYGLLVLPWPGLREGYAAFFRAGGDVLFGSFGHVGAVRFQPLDSPGKLDTAIVFGNRRTRAGGLTRIPSRHMGYLPTAVLICLVLATPISWPRRARALLWGLLLVHGFIALRLLLLILVGFSGDNPLALFAFHPHLRETLVFVGVMSSVSPVVSYVVPVLLWALVSFQRRDAAALLGHPTGSPASDRRGGETVPTRAKRSTTRDGRRQRHRRRAAR